MTSCPRREAMKRRRRLLRPTTRGSSCDGRRRQTPRSGSSAGSRAPARSTWPAAAAGMRATSSPDCELVLDTEHAEFAEDPAPIDVTLTAPASVRFQTAWRRDPAESDESPSPLVHVTCRPRPIACRCTASFRSTEAARWSPTWRGLASAPATRLPYFTAAAGSTHGYDVCNHNEMNPELGGEAAHRLRQRRCATHGLGHIVDFVPNHMGISGGGNAWWTDVLENGPSSPTAKFFDIDWAPIKAELHAKLLLPILGDQYGHVLERGELRLEFRDGALVLRYFEHELPVNPRQARASTGWPSSRWRARSAADNPHLHEFLSILASLENLPPYTEQEPDASRNGSARRRWPRARLARLVEESPAVRPAHRDGGRTGQRPARRSRRRSTRCTRCSNRRSTGCRTGARRRTKSITGGSSTSTRWPGCASRSRRCSRRRTRCSAG